MGWGGGAKTYFRVMSNYERLTVYPPFLFYISGYFCHGNFNRQRYRTGISGFLQAPALASHWPRGSQGDVVYRKRLSYMSPNAGGGGRCGASTNEYSCAHHVTWSPNKLLKFNSIFNLYFGPIFPVTKSLQAVPMVPTGSSKDQH